MSVLEILKVLKELSIESIEGIKSIESIGSITTLQAWQFRVWLLLTYNVKARDPVGSKNNICNKI